MMSEMWKPVPGWEGKYEICTDGRIKSYRTKNPRILKQHKDREGYWLIVFCDNGKFYNYRVHRLLALTFIPNPNNYEYVNHKDENKSNNNLDNLEWCTRNYNVNYGTGTQRAHEKCYKRVHCLETGEEFVSLKEAAKHIGVGSGVLCTAIKHKGGLYRGKHYGYI